MRSLIFFALLALSIVLTNGAAVEDYNEGKKHGLWTPDEAFFHRNPKLLGLGRQIGHINLGHLGHLWYFRPNYLHPFWSMFSII